MVQSSDWRWLKICWLLGHLIGVIATGYAEKPIRKVGIGLFIDNITSIHAQHEIIEIEVTLSLRWKSEVPVAKEQYYYGIQVDQALSTMRWGPYFEFLNTKGIPTTRLRSLHIKKDGNIDYLARYSLQIESVLNIQKFPFDDQIVDITIIPFGPMPYRIQYYLLEGTSGVELSSSAQHVEWRVTKYRNIIDNKSQPAIYTLQVNYERKSAYYVYKIFIPLGFILFIAYMMLWLYNQPSINRLAILVTSMLTIVAFQWVVSAEIPKVSYMTFVQAIITFCYALIAIEAALLTFSERISEKYRDHFMSWVIFLYPVFLLLGILLMLLIWFR